MITNGQITLRKKNLYHHLTYTNFCHYFLKDNYLCSTYVGSGLYSSDDLNIKDGINRLYTNIPPFYIEFGHTHILLFRGQGTNSLRILRETVYSFSACQQWSLESSKLIHSNLLLSLEQFQNSVVDRLLGRSHSNSLTWHSIKEKTSLLSR